MKIHLIVGSPGAGKTTYANALAAERNGLVFVSDDWFASLFIEDAPKENAWPWALARVARCEVQMWKIADGLLRRGIEVIMDINMMNRALREKQRAFAEKTGFPYQLHYLNVPREERWARITKRNAEKGTTYSFPISRAFFDFVESQIEPPVANELEGSVIVS